MEIKQEIVQIIDTLPEDVLSDFLQYVQQVEKESQEKMRLSIHFKTILSEDNDLLEKLTK